MATKITITIFSLLLCFQSTANNVVPFWNEDFSLGQMPSGWQAQDSNSNTIYWQHCEDFNQCPPVSFFQEGVYPNFRFKSASMENGFAYLAPFQSDGSHSSSLMTNAIDCSANAQVFLTFNTFIIAQSSDLEAQAVVDVKQGMFGNWETFVVFPKLNAAYIEPDPLASSFGPPLINSFNGQQICLDISSVAALQSEVYIRWRWDWTGGADYFWLVDDVNLLDENPLNENAIWGMAATDGGFVGGLNGWTVPPSLGCKWGWAEHGLLDTEDMNELADLFICSCTSDDGAVAVNALCNPSGQLHSFAELISPTIDLSIVSPGKRLGIRFTQSGVAGNVANNNLPLTSIMVSVDGGETFIDTIFLNITEAFAKPFCNTKLVPLPEEVIGSDQFVFKFVFSGNSFFWMVDDVRVVELYENDLRISEDYYAVAPNFNTPIDLIEPFGFRAEVQNVGNMDQAAVKLLAEVYRDDTHELVFMDTLFLGTIAAGEVSGDIFFNKKFLPEPALSYTAYYMVSGSELDEDPRDNVKYFQFETRGRVLSKQKDRYSINGGFNAISNNVRYEIGTCFFIPPGNGAVAYSVNFALANANQIAAGNTPVNVGVKLFKWKNGGNFGDENGDFLANENEYEMVAETFYEVSDGSLRMRDVIEVPFENPVTMDDSTYYFATIDYFSPAFVNGQQIPMFISGSEEINYNAMFEQSESSDQPRYVSMQRLFGETDFQVNAWGLLRVPFVQLNTEMGTPTYEQDEEELSFELFPNPTSGQFYVKVPEKMLRGKIAYEIYNICGRLALPRQNVEAFVSQLPIDASQLRNGLYNLRVVFGELTLNQLFVKVD